MNDFKQVWISHPRLRRLALQLAVTALGLTLLLILFGFTVYLRAALAQTTHHAGVVVIYGDDKVAKRCVDFPEDSITGLDALQRTGLDVSVDASNAMGVAVCKIGRDGCNFPGQTCFCQCQGDSCKYWSYWKLQGGNWVYSDLGASNTALVDGDVDGWVWGAGTTDSAQPPPPMSLDKVCNAGQLDATATATTESGTATETTSATPGTATTTTTATSTDATGTATGTATATGTTTTTATATRSLTPKPSRTTGPTRTPRPTWTRVLIPARVTPTRRVVVPAAQSSQRQSIPTRSVRVTIPTRVAFEPTSEPVEPPTQEFAPTNTQVGHTPTRVALSKAGSTNASGSSGKAAPPTDNSDVELHVLSVAVFGGGSLLAACGLGFLLLLVAWYWYTRRQRRHRW